MMMWLVQRLRTMVIMIWMILFTSLPRIRSSSDSKQTSKEDDSSVVFVHPMTGSKLHLTNWVVAHDREWLRERNIEAIVNVAVSSGIESVFKHELEYKDVDLEDADYPKALQRLSDEIPSVTKFIERVQSRGAHVLIHCVQGVSRSPSFVLAYLIEYHDMTLKEALDVVRSKRNIVQPNHGFMRELFAYEKRLRGKSSLRGEYFPS